MKFSKENIVKIERTVGEQRKLDRYGRAEKARIVYVASGVGKDQIDQAVTETFAEAPPVWMGIPKRSVEILHSPGGGIVEIGVYYRRNDSGKDRRKENKKSGDRIWSIEVNSRREWKKYAVSKILSRKIDSNAPELDPGLLVDWNGLRGTALHSSQIAVWQAEMSMLCVATFRRSHAESRSYLRQVADLVGKVNSEAFHNWHAGEVLFAGLVKSRPFEGENSEELCDLTFRFLIRPGGAEKIAGITLDHVDGWDYLWQINSPGERKKIHSIHVSRLYERASFAVLDL